MGVADKDNCKCGYLKEACQKSLENNSTGSALLRKRHVARQREIYGADATCINRFVQQDHSNTPATLLQSVVVTMIFLALIPMLLDQDSLNGFLLILVGISQMW